MTKYIWFWHVQHCDVTMENQCQYIMKNISFLFIIINCNFKTIFFQIVNSVQGSALKSKLLEWAVQAKTKEVERFYFLSKILCSIYSVH